MEKEHNRDFWIVARAEKRRKQSEHDRASDHVITVEMVKR